MPRALSPEQRAASLRGRIGAYALHAQHDSREITSAARTAFLSKFDQQVDPDRKLKPDERSRRAAAARSEHFARLAYRSVRARRKQNSNVIKNRATGRANGRSPKGADDEHSSSRPRSGQA